MEIKETIIELIQKSSEENIKGKFFRSERYLNEITFSDIMDIVILYLSLQPDIRRIGTITSYDFYKLSKKEWEKWISDSSFTNLKDAWKNNNVGPMDGYAGEAEIYISCRTRISTYKYLLLFFSYPEELPDGWPEYKQEISRMVMPKWKRKNNFQKIDSVFNLAEMICTAMRKTIADR
ncbi:MAG: hypothetical protein PHX92_01625 [Candidatus Pacebacteria bacterium]|nr:hypothetical protein [Candidatus Paceibacterota bacterium]